VRINLFRGRIPKLSRRLLPEGNASVATNCKLSSGQLHPYAGNQAQGVTFQKTGTIQSIFRYENLGWFHWLTDVDAAEGPVAGSTTERIYWTGDGYPKKSDNTLNGGPDLPTVSYRIGVPAPITAPVIATSGPVGDLDNAETRAYLYTFVTSWGEEGPPSTASDILSVTPDTQTVFISGLEGAPLGNYNFGAGSVVRIYRTLTGSVSTDYQLVVELPLGTGVYTDATLTDALSTDILLSLDYLSPPDTLTGLTTMPNGVMAAFSGRDLYFCEPYKPHAWPSSYILAMNDNIVAIGAFGNTLIVITNEGPYSITGTHPADMTQEILEAPYTCSSKRSLVDIGYAIIYATPEGLRMMGMNGTSLITDTMFNRREFESLSPSSMSCYYYDGLLFCFYDTGIVQAGFIVDPQSPKSGLIDLDFYATAGYTDPANGDLFLVVNGILVRFDGDPAANLEYVWRTGEIITNRPLHYGVVQVDSDTYPVTVNIYVDRELRHSALITGPEPIRIPSGFKSSVWEFEIAGSSEVNGFSFSETMQDLRAISG